MPFRWHFRAMNQRSGHRRTLPNRRAALSKRIARRSWARHVALVNDSDGGILRHRVTGNSSSDNKGKCRDTDGEFHDKSSPEREFGREKSLLTNSGISCESRVSPNKSSYIQSIQRSSYRSQCHLSNIIPVTRTYLCAILWECLRYSQSFLEILRHDKIKLKKCSEKSLVSRRFSGDFSPAPVVADT